jgi:hypothetical protein
LSKRKRLGRRRALKVALRLADIRMALRAVDAAWLA